MHNNILGSPTATLTLPILRVVHFDDGLVGEITIVIHFHLIFGVDGRIVEYNMLFRTQARSLILHNVIGGRFAHKSPVVVVKRMRI